MFLQESYSLFLKYIGILLCLTTTHAGLAADTSILVQSTTSTANSGFYDYLLPHFEKDTGIKVNVVAVGTGQAIKNASNCDADVLLVHAKNAEETFVESGFGVERFDLMYNDFVIVGPALDTADISSAISIDSAFQRIAGNTDKGVLFTSRGDNSGTHKKEQSLWKMADIDPTDASGIWYRETGNGMGATLNITVGMNAYTLTDRATWLTFNNRNNHKILFEGDENLFNQYGITLVNSDRCPHSKSTEGTKFIDWLLSKKGQQLIGKFKVGEQQLFFPNAATNP